MVEQLESIGAPPEVIDKARADAEQAERREQRPVNVDIWADCAAAWAFFQRLAGQWAFAAGMQVMRTGIPTDRIEAAMNLWRIPQRRRLQLIEDITIMERAVLTADREARARQSAERGD